MELLSDEKPSHSGDTGALPLPSVLDITDGSMKLLNTHHPTMAHHHQSLGRSLFLKRSRHYYGHQYSRRNSANHANASSSSRGKGTSSFDDRLAFKLASQPNSLSRQHTEYREKTFSRPERIRSSSTGMDAVSSDVVKMVCGICQKPLRRKFNFLGNSVSCSELSVVAVLVCGHVYHAECLEQRTRLEEQRDPPCPVCAGSVMQDHDSTKGQE
ncbi:Zinc finger, RING-type [Sesbania bispinosa]|nr:Zinc finger, RING-type [Sesbania bispinosa]